MTDLEMTRLCAKALGLEVRDVEESVDGDTWVAVLAFDDGETYEPLHNDAQAMALAKRFMLDVDFFAGAVSTPPSATNHFTTYCDESINRAIVECVAKMRAPDHVMRQPQRQAK